MGDGVVKVQRAALVLALMVVLALVGYGLLAGLGGWYARQTALRMLPGLAPLATATPQPTPTPGWWVSPLVVPTLPAGE